MPPSLRRRTQPAPEPNDTRRPDAPASARDARDLRIAELERDLHSLAHALRSPLVALKGFTGLLEEDAAERLDENGRHFLGRIAEASRRIEWRLDDLSQLLQLAEAPPACTWVDLEVLLEDLAAEIKPALEDRDARLCVPLEPPKVWADRGQLRLALEHLVRNALQHAVGPDAPDIHLRVEHADAGLAIAVIDGGPGIDGARIDSAFELFEAAGGRVRPGPDERESTGLGLALVRRVARAHGGEAHIERGAEGGTRVVVTLPNPPRA